MDSGQVTSKVNVSEILENSRIGPLQIRVFVLCALCLIIDGYDVQALGYAAPALLGDWGIDRSLLGPVFSAANVGVLIGSITFSMVADKIGRRPVLVGATLFFAVMTLAVAFAQNVQQLLWLRLIGGIGMGCIIPNATALVGEFSPKRLRVTLVMCITVGFTGGAFLASFIIAWLIPNFGWRSVFVFGGLVPLVIAVAMMWGLPESLQFQAVRRRNLASVGRWLKQLDPRLKLDATTTYVANEESRGGVPFGHLFRDGRAVVTVLLWIVNFMNLLNLYALSNWMPTVVAGMGYDQRTAVLVGGLLQGGGLIGTFGLAWLISRGGFIPMLTASFAVAAITIALIGQPGLSLALLAIIVFAAGWCVIGSQPGLNALAATFYPTYLRSTGVGAALGVGRIGAIIGPYLGGVLLARLTTEQLFLTAAIPAAVSTLTIFTLRFVMKTEAQAPARRAAPAAH